jgi:hypothetical protein
VIKNDAIRYRRKGMEIQINVGYGLVVALAMTIAYFFYMPEALRDLWPAYLSLAKGISGIIFRNDLICFHHSVSECGGFGTRQPPDGVDLQEEASLLRKLPHLERTNIIRLRNPGPGNKIPRNGQTL